MPFTWPLSLVKRIPLGRKITPVEEDQNKTNIEDAANELHATFSVALNPDGTLKNNSVSTASIQDRAVTNAKLSLTYAFWKVNTGTGDALVISFTPAVSAYAAGQIFWVQATAANTGAATLNAGAGAVAIKKVTGSGGKVDVAAGDMFQDGQYIFVHDGTHFVLLNPGFPPASSTGPVYNPVLTTVYSGGSKVWTEYDASGVVPAGAKAVLLQCAALWNSSTDGEIVTEIRKDMGSPALLLNDTGATDAVTSGSPPSMFPITAARHFHYQVTSGVADAVSTIKIVGYVL